MSQKTLSESSDDELISELNRRNPRYAIMVLSDEQLRQQRIMACAPSVPQVNYLYFARTDSAGGKC